MFQSYVTFTLLCRNKPECNDVHSYIVFIPVSMSKYKDIYKFIITALGEVSADTVYQVKQAHKCVLFQVTHTLILLKLYNQHNFLGLQYFQISIVGEIHPIFWNVTLLAGITFHLNVCIAIKHFTSDAAVCMIMLYDENNVLNLIINMISFLANGNFIKLLISHDIQLQMVILNAGITKLDNVNHPTDPTGCFFRFGLS